MQDYKNFDFMMSPDMHLNNEHENDESQLNDDNNSKNDGGSTSGGIKLF